MIRGAHIVRKMSLLWEKLTVEVEEEVGSRIDKSNTRWSIGLTSESTILDKWSKSKTRPTSWANRIVDSGVD